jgi:phage tail-like protein
MPNAALAARAARPAARNSRSPQWMLNQLPVGLLESDFFVRFVSIFQELGSSLLDNADNADNLLDVTVAPPEMVRWLGSWIGVESVDPSLPEELQRLIVAGSARSLRWRGTRHGIEQFLRMTTGGECEVADGGGVWEAGDAPSDVAWVRMSVESTGWLAEQDFVALLRDELPAHVRAQLFVGDRLIWSSREEALDPSSAPRTGVQAQP